MKNGWKTTKEKIKNILEDPKLRDHQKALLTEFSKHITAFTSEDGVLARLYTLREFGLFIKKPFDKAVKTDLEAFIKYKLDPNRTGVTSNRTLKVSEKSTKCYRFRIQGLYRWMRKHKAITIDNELAYPTPKIVVKRTVLTTEQRHERRVSRLLSNASCHKNFRPLPEHNLKILNDYHNYKFTSGAVTSNIGFTGNLHLLKRLGIFLGEKTYREATRKDIEDFLSGIRKANGKVNPGYKARLLDFYRFIYGMFGNEQPRKYPDVVSWLYMKRKKRDDRLPREIIPDSEIKAMIECSGEIRDRAMLALLRDCSARVGELTSVKLKDINIMQRGSADGQFKHNIATIRLKGKTGERINLLYWSVSYLRQWLSVHPLKDDPEAPLFVALKENRYGQRLTPTGVNKTLQKLARKAGVKRHIHAHLFRHTNLTRIAGVLSESELKIHAGWGENSKMASVYVHLTHEDVNNKILKNLGFDIGEEAKKEEDMLKVQICPNHFCGYENTSEARFCLKCGYPLNLKTAVQLKRVKEEEESLHRDLLSRGISGINIEGATDLREVMYQILKSDKHLIEKLKGIIRDAEQLSEVTENKGGEEK